MVTLEISSTEIRLMETEGTKVIRWASLALEPGIFEDEVITDHQALSIAVRQLMSSSGINASNITVSVSGLYSLSRIVLVPTPLGEPITQQAVLEATEAVVPLPIEELYLSWQTIGSGGGGQQVLVVTVPRDMVDGEMRALKMAGLNPRVLDLKSMALARAVNKEQALILNVEATSFDTVLVINRVTEVMHTAAWQQEDLSLEDRAEQLALALELTVGFHDSRNPTSPVDPATPLFVTGEMSGDLALMETLQTRFGYHIQQPEPPLEYPEHLPVSQYAVNIGLALKGTPAARNVGETDSALPDINLLPSNYLPWKPSPRQIYAACAIIAAAALLFPLYQVTSDAMAETAISEARYNIVNNELLRRQTEIQSREPLQKAINEYRSIVNIGGGFIDDLEVINSRAEELNVAVPAITHEGGSISFSCQADSYLTFREFKTALEESGRFSTPITPPEGYPYVKGGTIHLETKPVQ